MTRGTLPGLAAAALMLTACDLSQKKPETYTLRAHVPPAASAREPVRLLRAQPPVGARGANTRGIQIDSGASIRLHGPGVRADRQVRL